MRTQINPKLRYAIFNRDNFTCQYCGRKSPEVVLEVDHIVPVAKGGTNSLDNLVTACSDCNRGKGTVEVMTSTPRERRGRKAIPPEFKTKRYDFSMKPSVRDKLDRLAESRHISASKMLEILIEGNNEIESDNKQIVLW